MTKLDPLAQVAMDELATVRKMRMRSASAQNDEKQARLTATALQRAIEARLLKIQEDNYALRRAEGQLKYAKVRDEIPCIAFYGGETGWEKATKDAPEPAPTASSIHPPRIRR